MVNMWMRWLRDESISLVKSNVSLYCWPGRLTLILWWHGIKFCCISDQKSELKGGPRRWCCWWCCRWLAASLRTHGGWCEVAPWLEWIACTFGFLCWASALSDTAHRCPSCFLMVLRCHAYTAHIVKFNMYSNVLTPITCAACKALSLSRSNESSATSPILSIRSTLAPVAGRENWRFPW